ncbi:MAG TPA: hypothetical protein GYA10_04390 [Alphaproteobacteria bacterium]|nr:hypothetical protein [Alphaproteobacteria bacterium]
MTRALTFGWLASIAMDVARGVVAAARDVAKRRARRFALVEIMRMDLGIIAQDVVEALAAPRPPSQHDEARVTPAPGAIASTC